MVIHQIEYCLHRAGILLYCSHEGAGVLRPHVEKVADPIVVLNSKAELQIGLLAIRTN